MDRISVDEATRNLRDLRNVVANGKQRFVINNATEDVAAIWSTEDPNLPETPDPDAHQGKAGSVDEGGRAAVRGRLHPSRRRDVGGSKVALRAGGRRGRRPLPGSLRRDGRVGHRRRRQPPTASRAMPPGGGIRVDRVGSGFIMRFF